MTDRVLHIRISPENIQNDIFKVRFTGGTYDLSPPVDPCCVITASTISGVSTGFTFAYSAMSQVLSGGTDGSSLLTGLTIPIMLTQNTVDVGYYSPTDGAIIQKDRILNFIFSATSGSPNTYFFYNTSENEFKKFLSFQSYKLSWGDNSPIQNVTSTAPNFYSHTYPSPGTYQITFSGLSPWGYNIVKKQVVVPFTGTTIPNPYGTAYFLSAGGSWSATPISYDYLYSGDSDCDVNLQSGSQFTTIPITITGYTKSQLSTLSQYGPTSSLYAGKYKIGIKVTGSSESVGTFWGPSINNLYTAYTINDIDYFDYNDGTTIFVVKSSGLTSNWLICSALTKNEVLLNVIDEAEIQSNVFIDRGKYSGLERIERLGEIDNIGDLDKYGYGFFDVTTQ